MIFISFSEIFFYTEKNCERKGNNIKINVQVAAYFFYWDKRWKTIYFKSKINLKLHALAKLYKLSKWTMPFIKLLNPMYSYISGTGTTLIWAIFLIRIYFIAVPKFDLSEANISVLPSGMQRLFSPPALVRLQPLDKNLLSLQSKVRIAATVVPVQEGEDRNPAQPCTDSGERKGNLEVDILNKPLCLDLDSGRTLVLHQCFSTSEIQKQNLGCRALFYFCYIYLKTAGKK